MNDYWKFDRAATVAEARALLSTDPMILDTETTGLGSEAEICQIALITANGEVVFDQLVRPRRSIPREAVGIHGISNEDVADKPPLYDALKSSGVFRVLNDPRQSIGIFNSSYDLRVLDQSLETVWKYRRRRNVRCIMEMYARFFGDWNDYHQSYTWQSLTNAAQQCGLAFDGKPHTALSDARMSLAILKHMAEFNE